MAIVRRVQPLPRFSQVAPNCAWLENESLGDLARLGTPEVQHKHRTLGRSQQVRRLNRHFRNIPDQAKNENLAYGQKAIFSSALEV